MSVNLIPKPIIDLQEADTTQIEGGNVIIAFGANAYRAPATKMKGMSAYEEWLEAGNTGTVDDFLNSISDRQIKLFVQKSGQNSIAPPVYFPFNERLTVSAVVRSANALSASFEVGGVSYTHTTVVGVEVPVGTDFIVKDIEIRAGYNAASVLVIF